MAVEIVVVGTSAGGQRALGVLLGGLPKSFPLPVVVVQHWPRGSGPDRSMAFTGKTAMEVREAEDKDILMPGRVYIAPADYHLLVEKGSLALSTEAPVLNARPSIDVLFESVADDCGDGVIAVILTGASMDGAKGSARVKERGGVVVVQDPATAESPLMPRSAILAADVDWILPLPEIADLLKGLAAGSIWIKKVTIERDS